MTMAARGSVSAAPPRGFSDPAALRRAVGVGRGRDVGRAVVREEGAGGGAAPAGGRIFQ